MKRAKFKIGVGLLVVLVFIITVSVYVFFVRGTKQDVNWLSINRVNVSNEAIVIHAFNPNSGMMVTGYDYYVSNKTLYVSLKGTLANTIGKSIPSEDIRIKGNFSTINNVVLVGKSNHTITIWKRKNE